MAEFDLRGETRYSTDIPIGNHGKFDSQSQVTNISDLSLTSCRQRALICMDGAMMETMMVWRPIPNWPRKSPLTRIR